MVIVASYTHTHTFSGFHTFRLQVRVTWIRIRDMDAAFLAAVAAAVVVEVAAEAIAATNTGATVAPVLVRGK